MTTATIPSSHFAAQAGSASRAVSVPLGAVLGALFSLFALDNVLLLGFLGYDFLLVLALAIIVPAVTALLTAHAIPAGPRISLNTLCACFAVAILLLMLGGEGRLFYATEDWQIRDAVLRDMGAHRWPFDYWLVGQSQMLRAPLGMYLVPALLGAGSQVARDWALLAHNGLVLGLLFAAGSALFVDRSSRAVALVVFVMFSGLDVVGNALRVALGAQVDWDHLERWANNHQYSAHITQIFWVPQHAFAGWACALAYLLWRRGLAPIGVFGASIPLVALWSPLAIMGAMPFAIFAGVSVLINRRWGVRDVLLCAFATIIAIPSLLYLQAGAGAVSSGLVALPLPIYALILLLEVAPFLILLRRQPVGEGNRATLLIVAACLALMPLWSVGASTDFQMRASIMPLAILALAFADWMLALHRSSLKTAAIIILALGSVTGSAEIARALRLAPSPAPQCSLLGVWSRQSQVGLVVPYSTYYASWTAMPSMLVPNAPVDRVGAVQPDHCWDKPWRTNRGQPS